MIFNINITYCQNPHRDHSHAARLLVSMERNDCRIQPGGAFRPGDLETDRIYRSAVAHMLVRVQWMRGHDLPRNAAFVEDVNHR